MKKKISTLLVIIALCTSAFCVTTFASVATDTKTIQAEIKILKKEISGLQKSSNTSKNALKKARIDEIKYRELSDEIEKKLSAKRVVYKLAEERIANGNANASAGQPALAAEIKKLEADYQNSLEEWKSSILLVNDAEVWGNVLDYSIREKQKQQENLEEYLKSGDKTLVKDFQETTTVTEAIPADTAAKQSAKVETKEKAAEKEDVAPTGKNQKLTRAQKKALRAEAKAKKAEQKALAKAQKNERKAAEQTAVEEANKREVESNISAEESKAAEAADLEKEDTKTKLMNLLEKYRNNEISPKEYQKERSKILGSK